jgi:radical SAM protein with 4Fe4S-binding SPASM domain
MSKSLAERLVRIIHEIGIRSIIVIGGEPTLWKHLLWLNQFCKKMGIKTSLVTNGLRFANDRFWKLYQKSPNDRLGISLKAGNPEQLVLVAKSKKFQETKIGITRVAGQYSSSFGITYNVFYRQNLAEIVRLAVECSPRPVKIDFCTPIFVANQPISRFMVDPTDIVTDIVSQYEELSEITKDNISLEINTPLCLWPKDFLDTLIQKGRVSTVCQLIREEGIIFGTDGKVQMCNALFEYPIGMLDVDYKDAETLIDLWNSERTHLYYQQMRRYPSKKCINCGRYDICGGGCPLRWTSTDPDTIIPIFPEKGGNYGSHIRNASYYTDIAY